MAQNTYKETLLQAYGKEKYTIKGTKGTLIYQDRRANHIQGMIWHVDEEKDPDVVEEYDYLIFDLQEDVDSAEFAHLVESGEIQIQRFHYLTEIACLHPQVFTSDILPILQRLKLIKFVAKEVPNEQGRYPKYVNPRGWKTVYNMMNVFREGLYQIIKNQLPSKPQENEKAEGV